MMLTFSKWGRDPSGSGGLSPEEYPEAEYVPKPKGPGKTELIRRKPRPEVLLGSAKLVRDAINLAPGEWKYRSAVMSFAPEDIDVARFNAGAVGPRRQVDFALSMFLDWSYAGVPTSARPPVFVTTHTHTGRLEVNVLLPRWVLRPDGVLRSYNPDPPRRGARQGLQDLQSVLNAGFGWADPFDPGRRKLILSPDWQQKLTAEAKRQDHNPPPSPRENLIAALHEALTAGKITCAETLLQTTAKLGKECGLHILRHGSGYVTLGALDAKPKDRIRLRGPLFAPSYFKPSTHETRPSPNMTLDRLEKAWGARAQWNRTRYSEGRWPRHVPALAQRLRRAGGAASTLIPPRHYHLDFRQAEEIPNVPSPPERFRKKPAVATAHARRGAEQPDSRAGQRDCSPESRVDEPAARPWRFAEFAKFIAGPFGPSALFAALKARLMPPVPVEREPEHAPITFNSSVSAVLIESQDRSGAKLHQEAVLIKAAPSPSAAPPDHAPRSGPCHDI